MSSVSEWMRRGDERGVFERLSLEAVHEIAHLTQHLLDDLVATTPPKNREEDGQGEGAGCALWSIRGGIASQVMSPVAGTEPVGA